MTRWIPLATILGLSATLAVAIATRPSPPPVVVLTIVNAPAAHPAVIVARPAWCAGWDIRYSSIDLRPWCW